MTTTPARIVHAGPGLALLPCPLCDDTGVLTHHYQMPGSYGVETCPQCRDRYENEPPLEEPNA